MFICIPCARTPHKISVLQGHAIAPDLFRIDAAAKPALPKGRLLACALLSMLELARPAISTLPERTLWAGLTVWIVDAFLMGAADDPVSHGNGLHFMGLYEFKNFIV